MGGLESLTIRLDPAMTAHVFSLHIPEFGNHSLDPLARHLPFGMEGIMEPEADSPIKDDGRGRRRTRDDERGDDSSDNGSDGQEGATGSSRKRRRSRKGLDKKFECPHPGCGKSYSRAEHLYRHQLNRKCFRVLGALCPISVKTFLTSFLVLGDNSYRTRDAGTAQLRGVRRFACVRGVL